jgi:hypothetical protein
MSDSTNNEHSLKLSRRDAIIAASAAGLTAAWPRSLDAQAKPHSSAPTPICDATNNASGTARKPDSTSERAGDFAPFFVALLYFTVNTAWHSDSGTTLIDGAKKVMAATGLPCNVLDALVNAIRADIALNSQICATMNKTIPTSFDTISNTFSAMINAYNASGESIYGSGNCPVYDGTVLDLGSLFSSPAFDKNGDHATKSKNIATRR